MSGGSYNYLFQQDPGELLGRGEDLTEMRGRLLELGIDDVAREVSALIDIIAEYRERAAARMERVADVLQAVEWLDSNDWGEDRVREAVEKYRAANG